MYKTISNIEGFYQFLDKKPLDPETDIMELFLDPETVMKYKLLEEETGWFVWNMATYDLRDAVNISAMELTSDEDEFTHAGVTKAPCYYAPGSRVAESPAHFECKYLSTHRLPGNSNHGWVEVVYGEVKRIHVDDNIINDDGKLDITKIKPLARLGYYDYTFVDKVFEMRIPGASEKAVDGLEGKS